MIEIKVALAYEGPADEGTFIEIPKKIISEFGADLKVVRELSPKTGLLGFIEGYLREFEKDDPDIIILSTDLDGAPDRKKALSGIISTKFPQLEDRISLAMPEPHIEKWFLGDHNAVKKVFLLSGDKPLPFSDYTPKKQLEMMRLNMPEEELLTKSECKIKLVLESNIEELKKSKEFSQFYLDLSNKIRNVISS